LTPIARRFASVNRPYLPDAVLDEVLPPGGGLIGAALWVREKFANLLSAGTHASTFGGTPLCLRCRIEGFR